MSKFLFQFVGRISFICGNSLVWPCPDLCGLFPHHPIQSRSDLCAWFVSVWWFFTFISVCLSGSFILQSMLAPVQSANRPSDVRRLMVAESQAIPWFRSLWFSSVADRERDRDQCSVSSRLREQHLIGFWSSQDTLISVLLKGDSAFDHIAILLTSTLCNKSKRTRLHWQLRMIFKYLLCVAL